MTDRPFQFGGVDQGPDPATVQQAVATIAARDPLFNLDTFLAEAQQAFWLVGQAHARCKPELCAGVLALALAERERATIEKDCRDGEGSSPEDGDAETGRLVSIASDASHDTIVVHFNSTWRPVGGKGKADRRVQNWCFQRPADAKTTEAAAAGERCRNCGALLSESAGGTCRYCGTPIAAGAGWRIIRVDEVAAQDAASAVAAMQSIVSAMVAAGRLQQTTTTAPTTTPSPSSPSRTGWGFARVMRLIRVLFFLAIALAGLGFYAVESNGSVHRAAAKVFPSIRHPRLQGPLDLSGTFSAQHLVATQVPPKLQSGGSCDQAAQRTAWDFKTKLPDGSTFHLEMGLPPGTGAPGVYKRPQLSLTANAANASRSESWTAASASTAVLTVSASGGDLQFANLPMDEPGTPPLSGHLTWSCALS
ncbi:MAG: Tim44-like domain [Acidimicrobiaceae bacterium]|nr:Tim44-like domain [Acidimicrobiaceae bacterium]